MFLYPSAIDAVAAVPKPTAATPGPQPVHLGQLEALKNGASTLVAHSCWLFLAAFSRIGVTKRETARPYGMTRVGLEPTTYELKVRCSTS